MTTDLVADAERFLMGSDGWRNGSQLYAITHFPELWRFVRQTPGLNALMNSLIIDQMVYKMKTRPEALSTMAPYTSWDSLTDRTYSERHLPPDPALQTRLPATADVVELFRARPSGHTLSPKSTLLFPHFAQWFVDGFLRTDPQNPLRNTSTHDIDLSQLYGQHQDVTDLLRTRRGGELKSQLIREQEFPPYYMGQDGRPKPEFAGLPITFPGSDRKAVSTSDLDPVQRQSLFALGIARGNIHYGFVMMSTVWLREHNRLARQLAATHPAWDDERIFQTVRNVLIVLLLKIVVQDYINHITPFWFKLFVRPGIGVREKWYRQNWMSIEFDLLYRWHSLVPPEITVGGVRRPTADVRWHSEIVPDHGVAALFDEASRQPAGEIGLLNTADFLLPVEEKTINIGRSAQLAAFNDYRAACGYPRYTTFGEFSTRPDIVGALAGAYHTADDVELYTGLFAEDVRSNAALPTLMGTMVAVDAFSQALTNPLLAPGVYTEDTFSPEGMRAIAGTNTLADLVARNVTGEPTAPRVSFTQLNWAPQ
ncbi:MAG TPA: peroxidase family protein [Jatrophihabitans sp.]|jgi:prostaglandin-endoperoxide synthase 2|uniref:peroxidase family protein n=1 Tax=Jatrophihabitans sp. TaxID=1932789 RepID=UPI002F1B5AC2